MLALVVRVGNNDGQGGACFARFCLRLEPEEVKTRVAKAGVKGGTFLALGPS